jgi:protein O-GlcNAc transferase
MLWKLISGLLGRNSDPEVTTSSGAQEPENYAPGSVPDGSEIGGSLQDYIRQAEALAKAGRLNAALERYRRCVQTYPAAVNAYLGMGNVLVDLWSIEEAIAAYEKALGLAPHSSAIFSAVLFHSHYLAPADRERLFEQHRRFGEMTRKARPPQNARFALAPDPGRRIRIGYVSPNFSRHSVGYFVEPVIRCHDREHYEIFCYYTHQLSDETTARIHRLADGWRDIADAHDDTVEKMIRTDGIDILVDLAGHSKGNRLEVFARKPAPIQMTWLGYPDTTGLDTVDFRITDPVADPAPGAEQLNTERLLRIADVFLCYQPPEDSPPVNPHASRASEVTFSSFNTIAKLNEEMIKVWGKILAAVPGSHLVIKSASLNYPDTVDRVLECFVRNGVAPERIELRAWIAQRQQHLKLYDDIDIALDTFPYNGTTTTCEALWMGVPVVSLAGSVHMSRVGATILRCAGLDELVAGSAEDYADIAIALAQDQARRKLLRMSLRTKILASPLHDHKEFTTKLEHEMRQVWTAWCERQRAG